MLVGRPPSFPAAREPRLEVEELRERRILLPRLGHVLLGLNWWTTRSRPVETSRAAAAALTAGGANVVAAVVIGRLVDTADRPEKAEVWKRQQEIGFDFDTCCLE